MPDPVGLKWDDVPDGIKFDDVPEGIKFDTTTPEPKRKTNRPIWELTPKEALSRFAFGDSNEDMGVEVLGRPQDNSLLPRWNPSGDPSQESWPSYLTRGAYNLLVQPLGSAEGLIGASNPAKAPKTILNSPEIKAAKPLKIFDSPSVLKPSPKLLPQPTRFESGPEGILDLSLSKGRVNLRDIPDNVVMQQKLLQREKELKLASDNTGVKINPETILNAPPETQAAVNAVVKDEASKGVSSWKSVYSQLKELSPTLYSKAFKRVHEARQYTAKWLPDLHNAIQKLSPKEKENFGAYVEGSLRSDNPLLQNAVNIWKQVADDMGNQASTNWPEYGPLRLFKNKGEWVPFQKNENYWPHKPIPGTTPESLKAKLIADGMSPYEATRIVNHYKKTGEYVAGFQKARTKGANIPYRMDADSGVEHIRSMADRIAKHKNFGPEDVVGRGSDGILDLIDETSDKEVTSKLMERIVGRDSDKNDPALLRALGLSRKYAVYTKLMNFSIPNVILGTANTALKASRYPLESVKEVTKLVSKKYRSEMRQAGVWQDFAHSLAEEIKPGVDIYGIGAGEAINRGIAGSVGRASARSAFKDLLNNPKDKLARHELFELLGESPDELLKQKELSPTQLRLAAGRMAERTQGLNVPGNLAHWMSDPVNGPMDFAGQLFLTFKKMGYQQTKNVWESLSTGSPTDIARNVGLWLAMVPIAGEAVGDVKQGLRGMWTGDAGERIENRGSYWLEDAGIPKSAIEGVANIAGVDPEIIARQFDNSMQMFFMGLPADLLMSTRFGPQGMLGALAGPQLGDVSKAGSRIMSEDWKGMGKDILRSVPIPGSAGLADSIMED